MVLSGGCTPRRRATEERYMDVRHCTALYKIRLGVLFFLKHRVRLEREYSVSLIQVRETQVFVCARATLDWRIALDLKRVVGF